MIPKACMYCPKYGQCDACSVYESLSVEDILLLDSEVINNN